MQPLKATRLALAALCVLGLAACDTALQAVATRGAAVHDQALLAAEFALCQAASIGSIKRRYGATPDAAAAYAQLCRADPHPLASLLLTVNPPAPAPFAPAPSAPAPPPGGSSQ
jgi:hypothetical protein